MKTCTREPDALGEWESAFAFFGDYVQFYAVVVSILGSTESFVGDFFFGYRCILAALCLG